MKTKDFVTVRNQRCDVSVLLLIYNDQQLVLIVYNTQKSDENTRVLSL